MSFKKVVPTILLLFLLTLPIRVFAVDFTIPKVTIDAYLLENGEVEVVEKHTYDFDSKFKGILRELIPKSGSNISDFGAYEDGKELKFELKDGEYQVFRSGKKEKITIEMHYRITNGIEKYEDGTQFYWPFFDDRNETDYGDMTITIHPPTQSNDVLTLGYDIAYKKDIIKSDSVAQFILGEVPSGKNGDIRVIYEPELFPNLPVQKGNVRETLISDKNDLVQKEADFLIKKENTAKYGVFVLAGFGVLIFAIYYVGILKGRRERQKAKSYILKDKVFVPKEKMSIPATIYFTNSGVIGSETISAVLLNLVRKGYVKQLTDDEFEIVNRTVEYNHETELIGLLFDKVGNGKNFNIKDLESFTKDESNHITYTTALAKWREGIVQEVKTKDLKEHRGGLRWLVAFISLSMIVLAVRFAIFELFPYMTIMIVFIISGLLFAVFYTPKNSEGHQIIEEWLRCREMFEDMNLDDWDRLSTEDKFLAYSYAIGIGNKNFQKHFTEFASVERRTASKGAEYIFYNPALMSTSFMHANTNANVDAGGSSTSSSGGGGTGGGGGGSGAF